MALLLVVRIWLPPTFEGVDPEQEVSRRWHQQATGSHPNGEGKLH
jgi:hypothetical protein